MKKSLVKKHKESEKEKENKDLNEKALIDDRNINKYDIDLDDLFNEEEKRKKSVVFLPKLRNKPPNIIRETILEKPIDNKKELNYNYSESMFEPIVFEFKTVESERKGDGDAVLTRENIKKERKSQERRIETGVFLLLFLGAPN